MCNTLTNCLKEIEIIGTVKETVIEQQAESEVWCLGVGYSLLHLSPLFISWKIFAEHVTYDLRYTC